MQIKIDKEMYDLTRTGPNMAPRRGVIYSIIAHIVVIGAFIIQAEFLSRTATPIDFQSAVRVDVLGLPDKYTPEDFNTKPAEPVAQPAKPEPKPEPVPEPKKEAKAPEKVAPEPKKNTKADDAVNLKKNQKKQQDALQKLKAQSALDKIKDAVAKEKKPGKQIKGNAISPGTELTGLDKLVHQNYGNELNRHVKQFWALPEWLKNKNYRTVIKVRFNEKGLIISKDIVRPSGNTSFDENAMATIDQAAPFPVPPEKLTDLVRVDGILIGFPE